MTQWGQGPAPAQFAFVLIAAVTLATGSAHTQAFTSPSGSSGGLGSTRSFNPLATPDGAPAITPAQSALPTVPVPFQAMPQIPTGQGALAVAARFGRDLPPIGSGVTWRIYDARPDANGIFKMIKEDRTATPVLPLPPGNYLVYASLGYASVARQVTVRTNDQTREIFDIPAGGLRFEGRVGDVRIPPAQISFDLLKGSQFEPGEQRPVAQGLMTGDVILVPEGTYSIVSNYGDANSMVRSDIRVQAGKLTDVTVTHRAAVITLKLVGGRGGEALANTAWSVMTPGGDVVKESIGAFPRVILAEGEYRALARNEGKVYERTFTVTPGVDGEVEVLAH